MRSRWLAGLVACCALALPACGGGDDDADAIRGVIDDYASGLIEGDGERACGVLSENALAQIGGSRKACLRLVKQRGKPKGKSRKQLEDRTVEDLEIDGDTATALVKLAGSKSNIRTTFRKVDGEWFIDGQR